MTLPIAFRENTWDRDIFRIANELNEYELPQLEPNDIVIDIGCHIGGFATLAATKGSQVVLAFEALKENYELAKQNCANHPQIHLHNLAVWGISGVEFVVIPSDNPQNTGGGCISHPYYLEDIQTANIIHSITLDEIVNPFQKVNFLKLDCEGSEFSILYNCSLETLGKIDTIAMETHDIDSFKNNRLHLESYLKNHGFKITKSIQDSGTLGKLFVTK